jgi:hypothetical protein
LQIYFLYTKKGRKEKQINQIKEKKEVQLQLNIKAKILNYSFFFIDNKNNNE